jgi:hypothetical protein
MAQLPDQPAPQHPPIAVGALIKAVPDGRHLSGGREVARISLVLMPDPRPLSGQLNLRDWPNEVSLRLDGGIKITLGRRNQPLQTIAGDKVRIVSKPKKPDRSGRLWRRIFGKGADESGSQLTTLGNVLRDQLGAASGLQDQVPGNLPVVLVRGATGYQDFIQAVAAEVSRQTVGGQRLRDARAADAVPNPSAFGRSVVLESLRTSLFATLSGSATRADLVGGAPTDATPEEQKVPGFLAAQRDAQDRLQEAARNNNALDSLVRAPTAGGAPSPRPLDALLDVIRTDRSSKFWKRSAEAPASDRLDSLSTTEQFGDLNLADIVLQHRLATDAISFVGRDAAGNEAVRTLLKDRPITADDETQSVRRKFTGIMSRPALAAELGLIIDVEVDWTEIRSAIGSGTPGSPEDDLLIGAEFVQGVTADNQMLTAAEIGPLAAGANAPTYFGPASRYRAGKIDLSVAPDDLSSLKRGFLDLGAHSAENPASDRYSLSSFDNYAGFERLQNSVIDMVQRIMQGLEPKVGEVPTPELRTLGLSILDSCRKQAARQEQSAVNESYSSGGRSFSLLYAEDLLAGYRFDVRITTRANQTLWHSLTERLVRFDDALAADVALPATLSARDDGYSRPVTKSAENDVAVIVAFETLSVWGGASLALPPRVGQKREKEGSEYDDGKELISIHDAEHELAVDTILELPGPRDPRRPNASGLPPLRFSKQYLVGARCVWINGGGHSLREAEVAYRDGKVTLGAASVAGTSRQPYVHRRYEEISPPMVLLSEQDRLVQLEDSELARFPGEVADRLVLRPSNGEQHPVRRWLLPPRTSIDLAEQHGVLDELDNLKTGAFGNIDRDPVSGRFPDALSGARKSKLDYFDPQALTADKKYKFRRGGSKEGDLVVGSRGSVFRAGHGPTGPDMAYFPDPLAEVLFLSLRREGQLASGGVSGARPLQHVLMSPRKGWPKQAHAVALDLIPLKSGANGEWNIQTVTEGSTTTLRIRLAPGEELDLQLWSGPSTAVHLAEHWLVHRVSSAAPPIDVHLDQLRTARAANQGGAALDDVLVEADAVFHALRGSPVSDSQRFEQLALVKSSGTQDPFLEHMNTMRIPHLSGLRTLKLVHPVRKPLENPSIPEKGTPPQLQFHPVRILVDRTESDGDTTDPVALLQKKWRDFVIANGGLTPLQPIPLWESEAGATRAFFVGSTDLHRKSGRDLIVMARWTDWIDDATTVARDANGAFIFQPAVGDVAPPRELLTIKGLPQVSPIGTGNEVDLAVNDPGATEQLRYLSYEFGNTRARKLAVHCEAHSRFDQYYPVKNVAGQGVPVAEFRTKSTVYENIWVKATRRPAAPVLSAGRETLPAFYFHSKKLREADGTIKGFAVMREARVRVYLDRPWYDTGEGELLGVVVGPKGLFSATPETCLPPPPPSGPRDVSEQQKSDFEALIKTDIEPFLSRRGHDPMRISGSYPDPLLSPSDIGQCALRAGELAMPYTPLTDDRTSQPEQKAGQVAVAGFVPELDPVNGDHWYCDLPIAAGPSYWPFVRLGLVRWQPNAIAGHELSTPVTTWAQVSATREAEVTFEKSAGEMQDRLVTLRVSGQGFDEANFGKLFDKAKFAPDMRPRLDVRLVRADDRDVPAPGIDRGWTPVIDPSTGSPVEFRAIPAGVIDGEARWVVAVGLPRSRKQMHYALIIEEFTMMPADDMVNERGEPALRRGHVTYSAVLDFGIPDLG